MVNTLQAHQASVLQNLEYPSTKLVRLPSLPQSPILKKRLGRKEPRKREALPEERPLDYDPWAAMLAVPVRLCNVTRVRLPIPLLTNWDLVKHPESGDIYVLPDALADLDQLEQMGRRQLEQSERDQEEARTRSQRLSDEQELTARPQTEESEDHADLEGLHSGFSSESVASSAPERLPETAFVPMARTHLYPGKAPATRILASKQAIEALTDQLTYTERSSDPSKPRTTKPAANVMRVLPQHWRERIGRAQHYESNRKEVEKATGIKDPMPESLEATITPRNLKWQPDIGDRLLDILRRRVIISIRRIMEHATSSPRKVKQRSVTAVPQVLDVIKNGGDWASVVGELSKTELETPATDEDAFPVDIFPAERAAPSPYIMPRMLLYFCDPTSSSLSNLPTPPVPGRMSTVEKDESENASQKPIPLLPPLIPATAKAFQDGRHTPVFPVHALLDTERYMELLQALKPYDSLFSSESAEQVISVRAVADYSDVLFTEIWRLWRYVGGRKCLLSKSGNEVPSPSAKGRVREVSKKTE